MVRPILKLAALASVLGVFAASSSAVVWNLSTSMTGAQEVPPNGSTAPGTFTGTYDTVTNILNYTLIVNNLGSGATLAHIHGPAGPGVNASPIIDLTVVLGQTSFNYPGTASPGANEALWESLLMNGVINAYVNVHTTGIPGGEIRGQLTAVPEPATLFLLAPALLALRKRRVKH